MGTEASKGGANVDELHQTRPDVVIVEAALPGLDGWQVLTQVRDMSDAVGVILLCTDHHKAGGPSVDTDSYFKILTKPFRWVELEVRAKAFKMANEHPEFRRAEPMPARPPICVATQWDRLASGSPRRCVAAGCRSLRSTPA